MPRKRPKITDASLLEAAEKAALRWEGREEERLEAMGQPRLNTPVSVLRYKDDPEGFLETRRGRLAQEAHNIACRFFDLCEWLCEPALAPRDEEDDLSLTEEEKEREKREEKEELDDAKSEILRVQTEQKSMVTNFLETFEDEARRLREFREKGIGDSQSAARRIVSWVERLSSDPDDRGKIDQGALAEALEARIAPNADAPGRAASGWPKKLEEAIKGASFARTAEQIKQHPAIRQRPSRRKG